MFGLDERSQRMIAVVRRALFCGCAPVDSPRYACAVVQHGMGSSHIVAPITRDILLQAQKIDPSRRTDRFRATLMKAAVDSMAEAPTAPDTTRPRGGERWLGMCQGDATDARRPVLHRGGGAMGVGRKPPKSPKSGVEKFTRP